MGDNMADLGSMEAMEFEPTSLIWSVQGQSLGQCQQNPLDCLIHQLPNELLLTIFHHAVALSFADLLKKVDTGPATWAQQTLSAPFTKRYELRKLTALMISWTCRRWFHLAQDNSELWTHIDLRSNDCIDLYLHKARVGGVVRPLRLCAFRFPTAPNDMWYDRGRAKEIDLDCRRLLPRAQMLCYQTGGDKDALPTWIEDTAAPLLEDFRLLPSCGRMKYTRRLPKDFAILPDLFGGVHRLRYLELSEYRLPFDPGMYRNLSVLKIRAYMWEAPLEEDEDILVVFRECPALEVLDLDLLGQPSSDSALVTSDSPADRIPMRALRELSLSMPSAYIDHILGATDLPLSMMTRFYVVARLRDLDDVNSSENPVMFTDLLRQHQALFDAIFASVRELHIYRGISGDSTTHYITLSGTCSNDAPGGLSFLVYGDVSTYSSGKQLAKVLSLVAEDHLNSLETLVLEECASAEAKYSGTYGLLPLLARCRHLKHLTLEGAFLSGTEALLGSMSDAEHGALRLPRLSALKLVRCNAPGIRDDLFAFCWILKRHLRSVTFEDCTFATRVCWPEFDDACLDLLSIFQRTLTGLAELHLTQCKVYDSWQGASRETVADIASHVPTVTWKYTWFHYKEEPEPPFALPAEHFVGGPAMEVDK